jgi:hypothetical protein
LRDSYLGALTDRWHHGRTRLTLFGDDVGLIGAALLAGRIRPSVCR